LFINFIQKVNNVIGHVSHFFLAFSGILVLLMAWVVTYGVVKRYAFNAPDPYSYEISTMLLLFCGVLAVAGVEKMDRHVRNDILISRFPAKVRKLVLGAVIPFLALFFSLLLTWKSWEDALYALRINQESISSWAVPLAPIKFVIPAGYALLSIVLICKICISLATFFVNDAHDTQRK
jgi:TRAP-type mannitol/chloroaromatic compound transport system permease small subunit